MPFPLAHPAAVLPLRRFCPRRLSFPALVLGSLCPDIGYCFGPLRLEVFSHRFLAGSFEFCLPVGWLLLGIFSLLRLRVVKCLPARQRQCWEPLCRRALGSPAVIVLSLLIGAWTHILLDSVTHEHGWLAGHLPVLQEKVVAAGYQVRVCALLYSACTFGGVVYVAMSYLSWLERTMAAPGWSVPGFKPLVALAVGGVALLLSRVSQTASPPVGIVSVGVLSALLVIVFLTVTDLALRDGLRAGMRGQARRAANNGESNEDSCHRTNPART